MVVVLGGVVVVWVYDVVVMVDVVCVVEGLWKLC